MVEIPYSESIDKNEKKYGRSRTDVIQCLLCKKPITGKYKIVILDHTLGLIVMSDTEPNGGCFYIGLGCWSKNKQLHPYEAFDQYEVPENG